VSLFSNDKLRTGILVSNSVLSAVDEELRITLDGDVIFFSVVALTIKELKLPLREGTVVGLIEELLLEGIDKERGNFFGGARP